METKNIMAKSSGSNLKISFKKSCEVAKELKNLKVDRALSYLESVRDLKVAVPYRRFNAELGHKKGKGVDTGGYPKNVAIGLITLIKSAKKNAIHLGLDEKNLRILSVIATKGMGRYIPGRYSGRKMKSTNVEVCLVEKEKEVKKKWLKKK